MTESGKPFDLQNELRIGGRATAISILLKASANGDAKNAALLGEKALKRVEHQAAIEQPSPECPEAWLEGMFDIAQALREAISLLDGRTQE
jgi:hypothetical protein